MSTENTNDTYPIQIFGISTIGNATIDYYSCIITLPYVTNINTGKPANYAFSLGAVSGNTLSYTFQLAEGTHIEDMSKLSLYKAVMFLTQGPDYQAGELYDITSVNISCNDPNIPVNSTSSTIKKSSLFDPHVKSVEEALPSPYQMRYKVLGTTAVNNDPNPTQFLLIYTKVPSPAFAPVKKMLYVLADGTDLYCTSIPNLDANGEPTPKNTNSQYIVAAHLVPYPSSTPYTTIQYEGLPETKRSIT